MEIGYKIIKLLVIKFVSAIFCSQLLAEIHFILRQTMRNEGLGAKLRLITLLLLVVNFLQSQTMMSLLLGSMQTMRQEMEIGFKTIKQIIAQDCNFLSPHLLAVLKTSGEK